MIKLFSQTKTNFMKTKTLISAFLLFSILSCKNKPEPKLELFNPQAFAFDIGDSWEVNASVNAKGFLQNTNNNQFNIKLSYLVDMITPTQDTLKKIFTNTLANNQKNEFIDVPLEAQIELDSTFETGTYKLLFNITDEYSKQKKSIEVEFNLIKE